LQPYSIVALGLHGIKTEMVVKTQKKIILNLPKQLHTKAQLARDLYNKQLIGRKEDGMDIIKVLKAGGFSTVEGKDAVLKAIKDSADSSSKPLCSGFGVLPNGKRCDGCSDCDNQKKTN